MTINAGYLLWRELTGQFSSVATPDSHIDSYMDGGLQELNRRIGYHVTDDATTVVMAAATQEYTLPTDFYEMIWVEWQSGNFLKKSSMDQWRKSAESESWRAQTGDPEEYAVYGRKLVLYKTPDTAATSKTTTVTIRYVSKPKDYAQYGFNQLGDMDHQVPVYWAAHLWCALYPETEIMQLRSATLKKAFDDASAGMKSAYDQRGVVA